MSVATGPRPLSRRGLDDRAHGVALGVRLELLEVGDQEDDLEQLVDADARLGGHRNQRRVAAVVLDHDAGLGQLGLDSVRVGVRLVDLVERDDERDLGRLRVADRLERLGHDAVVSRDHDHRDVRDPGAAGPHGGECLVARGVEEHDPLAVLGRDLGGADVLRDAAPLARRDGSRADRVEEARLAVVDVAHDGHDRSARHEILLVLDSSSQSCSLAASAGAPPPSSSSAEATAADGSATS